MGGNLTEKVRIINEDGSKVVDVETRGSTNALPVAILDTNGNPITGFDSTLYSMITTDNADGNIEYIGLTTPDHQNDTNLSVWLIVKVTYTAGGNPVQKFADGSNSFNKKWDDRIDYTY